MNPFLTPRDELEHSLGDDSDLDEDVVRENEEAFEDEDLGEGRKAPFERAI